MSQRNGQSVKTRRFMRHLWWDPLGNIPFTFMLQICAKHRVALHTCPRRKRKAPVPAAVEKAREALPGAQAQPR